MRNSIFVDTGAFVAILDPRDDLHRDAIGFYRGASDPVRWVTTSAVVVESYAYFLSRLGRYYAEKWLDYLDEGRGSSHLRVIYTDERDGRDAENILRRFRDQDMSYTDALTLAAAARYDIRAIFGFDHHLALTGVTLLPGHRASRG